MRVGLGYKIRKPTGVDPAGFRSAAEARGVSGLAVERQGLEEAGELFG